MRTETEWNIDHTEFRCLVYSGEELVDATAWTLLRPYTFVQVAHPYVRALRVPLALLGLELLGLVLYSLLS